MCSRTFCCHSLSVKAAEVVEKKDNLEGLINNQFKEHDLE